MRTTTPKDSSDFVERIKVVLGVSQVQSDTEEEGLRYVIYVRKSTDRSEKQERSIGDQIHECKQTAERAGLKVVDILHEERSAKMSDNRPVFRSMLDKLLSGEYDGILTWAPDRLARNMKEAGEVIDLLDRGDIKDIRFANGYYFKNDAAGKMMLGIAFVQAKQFSDQHSQNIKRSIKSITEEGKCYDRPKHGYYKDANKYLRPDGANWDLIKAAFEKRLAKQTLRDIASWLAAEGYPLKTRHPQRKNVVVNEKFVSDLFRDPFFAGALIFGSNVVNLSDKYNFKPIITPAEFDLIAKQDGLNKKFALTEAIKPKGSIKADLLRGMVFCSHCNHAMSTGITPKRSKKGIRHYFYFRCDTKDCKQKGRSMRAKTILDAAYEFLDTHPLNLESGYKHYQAEKARIAALHDSDLQSELKSLNKRHEAVQERIEETKQLLAQNAHDNLLVAEFKADLKKHLQKANELKKEIVNLGRKRQENRHAIQTYEEFIELFKNLAKLIREIENMSDLDFILRKIFMNFVVDGKNVIKITQNSPFGELRVVALCDGSP